MNLKITCGKLDFCEETPPQNGHIHVYKDQLFTISNIERNIIYWSSACAQCGEHFLTKTGFKGNSITRRCKRHAIKGVNIKGDIHPASQGKAPIVNPLRREAMARIHKECTDELTGEVDFKAYRLKLKLWDDKQKMVEELF